MTTVEIEWENIFKLHPDDEGAWALVPASYRSTLQLYFDTGAHPGHFGEALLSNDLCTAARWADDENRVHLADLADFLRRFAPGESFGSPEKFWAWIRRGGLRGRSDLQE